MIKYRCQGAAGMKPRSWEGEIIVIRDGNPCEAEINARGSYFHVIAGKYRYGNFMCIPNWNTGTDMADMENIHWNRERLLGTGMREVDAYSLAAGIAALGKYLKK